MESPDVINIYFYRQCLKMSVLDGRNLRVYVNEPIHIVNHVEEHHRKVKQITCNAFGSIIEAFRSGYVELFSPPKTNEFWSRFGYIDGVFEVDNIDNHPHVGRNLVFERETLRESWPDLPDLDNFTRIPYIDPSSYIEGKEIIRKIVIRSNLNGVFFGVYHFKTADPYKIIRKLSRHPLLLSDKHLYARFKIPRTITIHDVEEMPFVFGMHRMIRGVPLETWNARKR